MDNSEGVFFALAPRPLPLAPRLLWITFATETAKILNSLPICDVQPRSTGANFSQRMRIVPLILLFTTVITSLSAQYTVNPLTDKRWMSVSGGANTADNISWQAGVSYAFHGETLLTQMRVMYSQELIEAPDDSCFAYKNRIAEFGIMWGDGWGGRHWYVSGAIGMGVNVRMYCDEKPQDKESFEYFAATTIGVPAQAEVGVLVSESVGINLSVLGNWNFRQPYIGAHLGVVYRLKKS